MGVNYFHIRLEVRIPCIIWSRSCTVQEFETTDIHCVTEVVIYFKLLDIAMKTFLHNIILQYELLRSTMHEPNSTSLRVWCRKYKKGIITEEKAYEKDSW